LSGLIQKIKGEIKFYQAVLVDPRTPGASKLLLGLAVAYALRTHRNEKVR
jgi:hypothetical protein